MKHSWMDDWDEIVCRLVFTTVNFLHCTIVNHHPTNVGGEFLLGTFFEVFQEANPRFQVVQLFASMSGSEPFSSRRGAGRCRERGEETWSVFHQPNNSNGVEGPTIMDSWERF